MEEFEIHKKLRREFDKLYSLYLQLRVKEIESKFKSIGK